MTKQNFFKNVVALTCFTAVLGLAGCQQQGSNDKTGKKAETGTTPSTSRVEQGTGQNTTSQAAGAPSDTTEKAGEYIDDSTITMRVKSALSNELLLKDADISVKTEGGIVQLSGTVPTEQGMNRAVEVAGSQKNVKSVQSALTVKPSIAK